MKAKTTSIRKTRAGRPAQKRSGRSEQPVPNEKAVKLIREWLADESGYEERAWPLAKRAIEENRLSERKRFAD